MSFLNHKFKNEDLDNEFAHISVREKIAYGGAEMFGGSLFYFAVLTFFNLLLHRRYRHIRGTRRRGDPCFQNF